MPILSDEVLTRLSAYKLPNRDGYDVPKPSKGMKEMACWCWAVSGKLLSVADKKSANSLYDALVQIDMESEPPAFTGYIDAKAAAGLYPKVKADLFKVLKDNEAKAKTGDKKKQDACKVAMMQILASLHV